MFLLEIFFHRDIHVQYVHMCLIQQMSMKCNFFLLYLNSLFLATTRYMEFASVLLSFIDTGTVS